MSSRQNEQIGRRIAAARSARRMSQSELANTAHVSWLGQRDEAFRCLQTARHIAPQQTREHPYVREALITLLRLHLSPSEALISYSEWARAV
ncbi:hypothetical protein GCM10009780_59660 [Actinomadura alba]